MTAGVKVRGVHLALHPPGEGVSDGIRRSGDFYEAEILDYIRQQYPIHRVIVDAGAMIGNHTVYFATFLAHVKVVAFEPMPANAALLVENTRDLPTVEVWPMALSDHQGVLRMAANPGNMGACLVSPTGDVDVSAVTLDSLGLVDVTFLKVDVEDHELELLLGARETIGRSHPLILIEDWSHGERAVLLPGYELEKAWPERFTYLYRPAA